MSGRDIKVRNEIWRAGKKKKKRDVSVRNEET